MSGSDVALIGRSGELARLATAASRAGGGTGIAHPRQRTGRHLQDVARHRGGRSARRHVRHVVRDRRTVVGRCPAAAVGPHPALVAAPADWSMQRPSNRSSPPCSADHRPVTPRTASTRDRVAVSTNVVGALLGAAAERPLALFLDDVHRADITVLLLLSVPRRRLADGAVASRGVVPLGLRGGTRWPTSRTISKSPEPTNTFACPVYMQALHWWVSCRPGSASTFRVATCAAAVAAIRCSRRSGPRASRSKLRTSPRCTRQAHRERVDDLSRTVPRRPSCSVATLILLPRRR